MDTPTDVAPDEPIEPTEPVSADPVGEATPEAPPQAPEASWAPSQDEWQQMQAAISYMIQSQQPQQDQPEQEEPTFEIDPFEPESIQRYVQYEIQRGVNEGLQQALGPYQGAIQATAAQQGEAAAREAFEGLHQNLGSFDEDAALMMAAPLIANQYDPHESLQATAKYMSELESRIRKDERSKVLEEMKGLSNAPSEEPVGSPMASELETVPTGPKRYEQAIERALSRRNPSMPVG